MKTRAGGAPAVRRSPSPARRGIAAVGIGNAIEWYDFAIYGSFATVLGVTFFPGLDAATQLLLAFAVYGTALLVRPLGALVFGRLGDTRGRRPVLAVVIVLMSVATAAVGLLPGYLAIGIAAPILLLLFRVCQGLGAGGELGVSSVFLFEHAPHRHRGAVGSFQVATLSLGMAAGMAVAAALSTVGGGTAVQAGWWRLAFLTALPLGMIGWYVRTRVNETGEFLALRDSVIRQRPWRRLFADSRSRLWRGFVIMGVGSLAYNTFFVFLPNHHIVHSGGSSSLTWFVSASALVVTAVAAVTLGHLSDRIGRRPVVAGSALGLLLLAVPMSVTAGGSLLQLWIAQCLIGLCIGGVLSVAMLAEAFPAEHRSTAVAMTAGLGTALIGGTAPAVDQLLVTVSGVAIAPGIYLAVVAGAALLAASSWDRGSTSRRSRRTEQSPVTGQLASS
ncbi:MAG TPA: MFS transporter [Microlunatus sp.]|nr:MFS transporter [Microlunatus sp.]